MTHGKRSDFPPLYVTVRIDDNGHITAYPKGGGSSTTPQIRAHDNIDSARRSARMFNARVMRVTDGKLI